MNWSFLIAFGIGLGVYFVAMGIFAIIKYFRNKKKLENELKEYQNDVEPEQQEKQVEDINDKK